MKHLAVVAAVITGFCLGVFYGFNQGTHNYAALEGVLVGYINASQVNRLKTGSHEDIDNVRDYLLIGIDHGLDQYLWYQEKGNHFLSNLLLADHVVLLDKSVRGIAAFRSENPEINLVETLKGKNSKNLYTEMYAKRQSAISDFGKTKNK